MTPYEEAMKAVDALREHVATLERNARKLLGQMSKLERLDTAQAMGFLKEPWCILPKSREEWWVVIPKWTGVTVGWLERATETYNVFVVNRFSHWLGGVPEDLREKLNLPEPFQTSVEGDHLVAERAIADRFGRHLAGADGDKGYRIKRGHEFDLIAELIQAGSLPFRAHPVDEQDLREYKPFVHGPLATPRDYQEEAWTEFLRYGAAGIYLPFGQGKSVMGARAVAALRGSKLIVVPTVTLMEQWTENLHNWMDYQLRTDVRIITYNGWEKVKDSEWMVTIFDECHRLPANTFSRLASIRTKYRMGLSATPYREDGRTNYIFALTGKPIGVDWTRFIRDGLIRPPEVEVRIVKNWTQKEDIAIAEAKKLAKGRKALVFCDSLTAGERLARRLGCPFIYSDTKNRLEAIRGADVVVVSRVGDEGLSLPNLSKVIEVDYQGGSRRQEGQRVGRLFHADQKGEHLVLMTQEEYDKFERRFLALEEKGIRVEVRRV